MDHEDWQQGCRALQAPERLPVHKFCNTERAVIQQMYLFLGVSD